MTATGVKTGFTALARSALAAGVLALLGGCATVTGGQLVSGNAPVGQIAIRNETRNPINAVTISRCGAMSHGLNRLSGQIAPGQGMRWRVDAGCWDIQAAYGYGTGYDLANFSSVQVRGGRTWLLRVQGPNGGPRQEM